MRDTRTERIALVSMPWMSPNMPSIQLATLAALLEAEDIPSERFEFFVDWVADVGQCLYKLVCDRGGGFVEEWIFAHHCFDAADGRGSLAEFLRVAPPVLEQDLLQEGLLRSMSIVAEEFAARMFEETDWEPYDIVGFSCTIYQISASLAMARLLKARFPEKRIVFGGAQCAGPMGMAVLRAFPEVDVVVRTEAEPVLVPLVRALRAGGSVADLPGVSWRDAQGVNHDNPVGSVTSTRGARSPMRFESYLGRLNRTRLAGVEVWLPFESSRGCWWGEKKQCTFCGLHEIMKYRSWDGASVLEDLEDWHRRYSIPRFFAVDLIMPLDFFSGFLPELSRRGHEWSLFYEIKANLKRPQVEALAAAGVRWIQPGIESLDKDVLQRMKKGVTPMQNVQLLKWAREFGIHVTWNVIYGIPGEAPEAYPAMASRMKALVHLQPPSGCNMFELHRFSPYFDHPGDYGLRSLGPQSRYRHVFPVADEILKDLVYQYDYEYVDPPPEHPHVYAAPMIDAVREWQASKDRGAALELYETDDGGVEIFDSRTGHPALERMEPAEAALYRYLDEARPLAGLAERFARARTAEGEALGDQRAARILREWVRRRWVLCQDGQVLALAVDATHAARTKMHPQLQAPVPYLVEAG